MAGPRTLLLLLLIALVLECAIAGKKKKPCKYNKKKYAAGTVIESMEDYCVKLKCSNKGKKAELVVINDCTCCKEGTKPPTDGPNPTEPPTDGPNPTEPPTDCDYSDLGDSHTMNLEGPVGICKNATLSEVSYADKMDILKKHNELRERVANGIETIGNPGPQPSATNMKELRWNSQLAEVAQAWAEQCPNGHDSYDNRKICDPTYTVGQNMCWFWNGNPGTEWENCIQNWYDEVKDMPKSTVDSFESPSSGVIGHYTQVVWWDTYEVGCGAVIHPDKTYGNTKIYVCNYGKAGNWLNSPVYESGTTASKCPNGKSTDYPGLCA